MREQSNGARQAERDQLEADIEISHRAAEGVMYGSDLWHKLAKTRETMQQRLYTLEDQDASDGVEHNIVGRGGRTV